MREESFGPVIGIQKVARRRRGGEADERHALRPDGRRLHARRGARQRMLAQVHAGSVYWNCCDRVSPRLPWSGSAIRAWA
jgi:acyl-CoA reductase-like NAD-dependent aldehyde dehydrogenase